MSRRPENKKKSRWLTWLLLLGGAIAALLYQCGQGFGIGLGSWTAGSGEAGSDEPSSEQAQPAAALADAAAEPPCQLRLDARGLHHEEQVIGAEAAAESCRDRGAVMTVTGDARYGDVESARATLRAAGVDLVERLPNAPTSTD